MSNTKTTEAEVIEQAENLSSRLIFEVISREGVEELNRPRLSLMWSGIAAGIMISLSVLGEAVFRTYLPDADWVLIPEHPATHSDHIRPPVPTHSATCDASP